MYNNNKLEASLFSVLVSAVLLTMNMLVTATPNSLPAVSDRNVSSTINCLYDEQTLCREDFKIVCREHVISIGKAYGLSREEATQLLELLPLFMKISDVDCRATAANDRRSKRSIIDSVKNFFTNLKTKFTGMTRSEGSIDTFFDKVKQLFEVVIGSEKVNCALNIAKGMICLAVNKGWDPTCANMIFEGIECLLCPSRGQTEMKFMKLTVKQNNDVEQLPQYQEFVSYTKEMVKHRSDEPSFVTQNPLSNGATGTTTAGQKFVFFTVAIMTFIFYNKFLA